MSPSPRLALVLIIVTCVVVAVLAVDSAEYVATLEGNPGSNYYFGKALATHSKVIVVGAPRESVNGKVWRKP